MTRRYIILVLLFFTIIAHPAHAGDKPSKKTLLHLAILNSTNYTGSPELDWIAAGALDMAATRLAYMKDIVLVPLPEDFINNPLYSRFLPEFDIRQGLSVVLGNGTNNKPYLAFMLKDLASGSTREITRLSGYAPEILSALPGAVSTVAEAAGYAPSELERRRATAPITTSAEAWKYYTLALYQNKKPGPLEKALKADPGFTEARAKLGILLLIDKKYDRASVQLREALKQKPYLHTALAAMGLLHDELDDRAKSAMFIEGLKEANLRNGFAYVSWNLDEARENALFGSSDNYKRLGTEAALAGLASPVTFVNAFKYLKDDVRHTGALRATLKSPSPFARTLAMAQFGEYGIALDSSELAALMNSNKILARSLAIDAFITVGRRKDCPAAIRALAGSSEFNTPAMQEEGINQDLIASTAMAIIIKCDASHAKSVKKFLSSADKDTRLAAASILGTWGNRDNMDIIAEAAGIRQFRRIAIKGLKGSARAEDTGLIKSIIETTGADSTLYNILASFDTAEAYSFMESAIYNAPYHDPINALRQSGSVAGLKAILKAASSDDVNVRSAAVRSLGKMPQAKGAIPVLIALLDDPDKAMRIKAVSSLCTIAGTGEKDLLLMIMNNEKADDRVRATVASEYKGLTVKEVEAAIANSGSLLKEAVLSKLAQMDMQVFYRAFEAHVSIHDIRPMRLALATIATGAVKSPPANPKTIEEIALKALTAEDAELRIQAAMALGALGMKTSLPALTDALRGASTANERTAIVSALGNIRDMASARALENALKDKNNIVRVMAMASLVKIGERQHMDSIINNARESGKYPDVVLLAHDILHDHLLIDPLSEALGMLTSRDRTVKALRELGAVDRVYAYLAENPDPAMFKVLRSRKYYDGNLDIMARANNKHARATGYYMMAMKALDSKDHKKALKYAGKSCKYARKSDQPMLCTAALVLKAEAETALGKNSKAIKTLHRALKTMGLTALYEREVTFDDIRSPSNIHLMLGKAYAKSGDIRSARFHLAEARRTAIIKSPVMFNEIISEAIQISSSLTEMPEQ